MKKLAPFLVAIKSIVVLIIFGIVYLFVFKRFDVGIPCIFRLLTGLKCPGCGMTHAIAAISEGSFKEAIDYNALSLTVLPVTCMYLLYRLFREQKGNGEDFYVWEYVLLGAMVLVALAYGLIRNIF